VSCRRNEAIFLPAGNLHAYLHGIGVEIMANSDNVLRGGLTPKHVDVPELLKILDFRPGFPGVIEGVEQEEGVFCYPTPAPEFSLWRLECGADGRRIPGEGTGRVVLAVAGAVTLRQGGGSLDLAQGQAAFVFARDTGAEVVGRGTVFVAAPGVDGADQMTHQLDMGRSTAVTDGDASAATSLR
jgi:mannose-6-phosphate isomerase